MQCQLLLLKRSLSLGFFPLLLVSVLEGRAVFLTCGMLRSWGRAWKHQNFYRDHPVSLTAAFFGQKSVGTGSVGACREGCTVFMLYKPSDFPGGASGSQRWVKEDVLSLAGCILYLQVLSVQSALSW